MLNDAIVTDPRTAWKITNALKTNFEHTDKAQIISLGDWHDQSFKSYKY